MRKIRRFVLGSAVAVLASASASASSIYTDTFNFGPVTVNGLSTIAASLHKFDSTLLGPQDSLQSIVFSLSVTDVAGVVVTNAAFTIAPGPTLVPGPTLYFTKAGGSVDISVTDPNSVSIAATPAADVTFTSPGQAVANIYSNCVGMTCTITDNSYRQNGISNTATGSNTLTNTNLSQQVPTAFAPYVAVGTSSFISNLNINLGPTHIDSTGDAGLTFGATAQVNGALSVAYTYVTVPEPVSMLLIGSGLGLVGLFASRRKRSNA